MTHNFKVGDTVKRRDGEMFGTYGEKSYFDKIHEIDDDDPGCDIYLEKFSWRDSAELILVETKSEIKTGPVQTIKTIVPGRYGRLEVNTGVSPDKAYICLVDNMGNRHAQVNNLNAAELRDTAKMLNELAEFLEQSND